MTVLFMLNKDQGCGVVLMATPTQEKALCSDGAPADS